MRAALPAFSSITATTSSCDWMVSVDYDPAGFHYPVHPCEQSPDIHRWVAIHRDQIR